MIGVGVPWRGFGTKFVGYQKELKELNDPERVVVLIDADDVIANGPPEEFLKNYLRISQYNGKNRIVSSSEMACCVRPMNYNAPGDFVSVDGLRYARANHIPGKGEDSEIKVLWTDAMRKIQVQEGYKNTGNDFSYLNSGMIVGRLKDIITMFDFLKAEMAEDDQALFTEYFLQYTDRVLLDYHNVLFSNAHAWFDFDSLEGCFYQWNGKQFINSRTETKPGFIQTPAKYWTCYNWLLKKTGYAHVP